MGIKENECVTICMPNTPEALTCFYALNKLGIQGTVAFDAATNKLYYSLVESETTEWLYVSTLKDGKFTVTKRLEIEGMGTTRGNNAFMANAGWSYISKTKSILQNPALAKNGTRLYFTSATIENGKGGKIGTQSIVDLARLCQTGKQAHIHRRRAELEGECIPSVIPDKLTVLKVESVYKLLVYLKRYHNTPHDS